MIAVLLLVFGFILLIKGADWLVSGASSLAKKYRVSELVIGLTIVAFGTSSPELVVNIMASAGEYDEVVFGNVIGSNIFNLLLILGVAGLIYPIAVQVKTVWKEIPYSILAGLILLILVNDTFIWKQEKNIFRSLDGIILIFFFIVFLIYTFRNLRAEEGSGSDDTKVYGTLRTIIYIIVGFTGLIIGGRFVVKNAVEIAYKLSVSEKLIGLTIVSVGTSLPELATSAVAALKKKSDLAIGNVIGSNIFNIFLILGVSGLVSPLEYNTSFNTDIFVYLFGIFFLFVAMFTGVKKRLDRWEAALLLLFFVAYMVFLVWRK